MERLAKEGQTLTIIKIPQLRTKVALTLGWKGLPGASTPALDSSVSDEGERFMPLTPGARSCGISSAGASLERVTE
jgi:hypothetical protein